MAIVLSSGPAPCSMSGNGEYIEELETNSRSRDNVAIFAENHCSRMYTTTKVTVKEIPTKKANSRCQAENPGEGAGCSTIGQ